jgi:hypothetical protein
VFWWLRTLAVAAPPPSQPNCPNFPTTQSTNDYQSCTANFLATANHESRMYFNDSTYPPVRVTNYYTQSEVSALCLVCCPTVVGAEANLC